MVCRRLHGPQPFEVRDYLLKPPNYVGKHHILLQDGLGDWVGVFGVGLMPSVVPHLVIVIILPKTI